MSHEIDLENYNVRTDMIIESFDSNIDIEGINHNILKKNENLIIEETFISKEGEKHCNKKEGFYTTISFDDITDKNNFKEVEKSLTEVIKKYLDKLEIDFNSKVLVIGLGNSMSTPDALGPKVVDNILVTSYLFKLGEVEDGYMDVCSFKPSVTGITGIETSDLVRGVVDVSKPDFLIIIDALASSSINRVNKTIQLTDAGILPGSGVGNNRKELSRDTYNIPVISIGVPTVVDYSTIVSDTLKFMLKQFSYKIENFDNSKLKFVPESRQNYLNSKKELTIEEKESILGMIGTLEEEEVKDLVEEVLSPIGYNLMVTPKEVDFIIDKLALLIGNSINKSLHKNYNPTN